ncbi:DUF6884 domain-containing protein [Rhizobium leguminosarum]|uniref:DUF6884 domain-containing protein n=1 Tax=Rhizobium leguminosarum TaxID=384 RepID=UPI00391B2838
MCSRLKRAVPSAARDLYDSPRYLRDRAAAEATCDDWLILSGMYGLVDPDCVIDPYDFNLNAASPLSKFLLCVRIWCQLFRRVGLMSPFRVELYAEGAYRACAIAALCCLGFRIYPVQGKGEAPATLIRANSVRGQ